MEQVLGDFFVILYRHPEAFIYGLGVTSGFSFIFFIYTVVEFYYETQDLSDTIKSCKKRELACEEILKTLKLLKEGELGADIKERYILNQKFQKAVIMLQECRNETAYHQVLKKNLQNESPLQSSKIKPYIISSILGGVFTWLFYLLTDAPADKQKEGDK